MTLYVGHDGLPIEFPKVFLTKYSKMFRVAFDGSQEAMFAEGAANQMSLPEGDIRDFMVMLRILIHQPQIIHQMIQRH